MSIPMLVTGAWSDADSVKTAVKTLLSTEFGIGHSTLEMECAVHACADAEPYGET